MKKFVLVALALSSKLALGATVCDKVQADIDQFESIDSLVNYLKVDVEKQKDFTALFQCLAGAQRMPTDLLSGDRDFIYGDGWGSARANNKIPLWNEFQAKLGRSVWGGKILKKSADGVSLLNVMRDRHTMSYAAVVYNSPSVLDGQDSIVLDYRADTTVPVVSPLLISRVRDELREIPFQGVASEVYLGRAYLYTGALNDRFSTAWEESSSFIFAANFILDFRAKHQEEIPSWALPFFE